MSKTKFRYNPKTLSYERVHRSVGERILRGFIFVAPVIALGLVFGILISYNITSPKEKALKKENSELKTQFEKVQKRLALINRVTEAIRKRDAELYRTTLGASSFPKELRIMGTGGSDIYAPYQDMTNSKLIIETVSKLDKIERKLHAQSISFKHLVKLAKQRKERLACLPAIQPIDNKNLTRISSGFGWRTDPIYGTKKLHSGVDFACDVGTKVHSTGKGVVELVRVNHWGYGKEIIIKHGFGYETRYGHLSKFLVEVGDSVQRGDVIALSGSTGKSTGPHCHYEVIKGGRKVNPIHYFHSDLTPQQYEEIVRLANNSMKSMD